MLLYTDSRKKVDHSSYGLLFTLNAFDLSWLTDCNLLTSSSDILRILRLKKWNTGCVSKSNTFTWSGPKSLLLLAGHSSRGVNGCSGGGLWWCACSRRWWRAGRFHGPVLLFTILSGKLLRGSEWAHLSGVVPWSSLLLRCRRGPPFYWEKKNNTVKIH